MKRLLPTCALALAAFAAPARAATTWTDGGHDSLYNNAANWSNGVPGSDSATGVAIIGTQPTDSFIGLATGVMENRLYSLTLSAGLSGDVHFAAAGVEQLALTSSLSNASSHAAVFELPFFATQAETALLTYTTGGGLEFAGGLTLGTVPISASGAGAIKLGQGNYTTFGIASATQYGALGGSAVTNYNGTDLQFNFSFTPTAAGSLWDFFGSTTGALESVSFTGANLNGSLSETSAGRWTGTVGGKSWVFLESTGELRVVPEPGSVWLLALAGASRLATGRQRRRSLV